MRIDRVIIINWGTLPNREYAMGPLTLFTGGNGTGKTTLADAIQTVMTAARDTFYKFNPGQDESSQRGRYGKVPRTLASYVLGADRNKLARPTSAHGYVALVFRTTAGVEADGDPFTALIGVSADLGTDGKRRAPRTIDQVNLILTGVALKQGDLVTDEGAGRQDRIVPVEKIENHLKVRFGSRAVRGFRDKIGYLKTLWGYLRNCNGMAISELEAAQATRTWSRLMAHSPIGSINDFVRHEILERRDVAGDLDHMIQSVQTFNQLKQQAAELEARIETLRRIEQYGTQIERGYRALVEKRLLLAEVERFELERRREQAQERIETFRQEQHRLGQRRTILKSELEQADDTRIRLEAERGGHPVLIQKRDLERTLEENRNLQRERVTGLLVALQNLQGKLDTLDQLAVLAPELRSDTQLADGVAAIRSRAAPLSALDLGGFRRQLQQTIAREESLYDPAPFAAFAERAGGVHIDDLLAEIRAQVANRDGLHDKTLLSRQRLVDEHQRLSEALTETEKQLGRLRRGEQPLPPATAAALEIIREEQPGARPRVLCELVEMSAGREDWQPVIEAYLGGNRFVILVEPDYESGTTRLLKQQGLHRCKIVQGEHARKDAAHRSVEPNTLVNCLKVDDPTALAYLLGNYGNVKLTGDMETLRWTPRGIMKEGFASGGYTQFPCLARRDDMVFGHKAREYRIESLLLKKQETEKELAQIDERLGALGRLSDCLQTLKTDTVLEETAITLYDNAEQMARIREQIAGLDLRGAEPLEQRYQAARVQIERLKKEQEAAIHREGEIAKELQYLHEQLEQCTGELTAAGKRLETARERVRGLSRPDKDYDADDIVAKIAARARGGTHEAESLTAQIEQEERQFNGYWPNYRALIREYNGQGHARDESVTLPLQALEVNTLRGNDDFFLFMSIQHGVRARLHVLESSILIAISEQLEGIKQEIDKAVTNDFVNLVMDNIRKGEQQIRDLNQTLKQHRFGDEEFEFVAHPREGIHGNYRRFFKSVADKSLLHQEAFSIFDDNQFDARDIRTRDEIMDKLFQGGDARVREELLRMADYREYFDFDIYRVHEGERISLAEDATGSGGQLETAAYAIRSASVINAFKLGDRRSPRHCRFLLFDETFAKTDEQRSVEILKLLTRSLKLQILFVVPSRAAGVFKPVLTDQHVFTKFNSVNAPGELSTVVEVKSETLDREKVARLWEQRKEEVMIQAGLEFDAMEDE